MKEKFTMQKRLQGSEEVETKSFGGLSYCYDSCDIEIINNESTSSNL